MKAMTLRMTLPDEQGPSNDAGNRYEARNGGDLPASGRNDLRGLAELFQCRAMDDGGFVSPLRWPFKAGYL